MRYKIEQFIIDLRFYRRRWMYGMIAIVLLAFIGGASHYNGDNIALVLLILIWPIVSIILWTSVNVASARIIKANKKLEEKNGVQKV